MARKGQQYLPFLLWFILESSYDYYLDGVIPTVCLQVYNISHKQTNAHHFPTRPQMGRGKLALPSIGIRPQLRKLVPTAFLQRDRQFRCKDSRQVSLSSSSRTTQGSSLAIHLPDAQARCYITVQKDGIAFAALADEGYPERVAFMVLKKVALEFGAKYESGMFSKTESNPIFMQRTKTWSGESWKNSWRSTRTPRKSTN